MLSCDSSNYSIPKKVRTPNCLLSIQLLVSVTCEAFFSKRSFGLCVSKRHLPSHRESASPLVPHYVCCYQAIKENRASLKVAFSIIVGWVIFCPDGQVGVKNVFPAAAQSPLWQRQGPAASTGPGAAAPVAHA